MQAGISRGLTFAWFAFTLLWFWSIWHQIGALGDSLGGEGCLLAAVLVTSAAAVILAMMEALRAAALRFSWSVDPGQREPVVTSRYTRTLWGTMLVVVTVSATVLLASPAPDIVYKAF